ncbi:MAG: GtrA family protein [Fibromonadaceae bacterium]|jgi:putative flippase GtrA|nr:GtrA family protein [Fibromonadaceae bacterium]
MKVDKDFLKLLAPMFIQYFFAGLFCAFVNWGFFYFLNYKLGMYYLYAVVLCFFVSSIVNFILCKIIFKSKEGRKKRTEFAMVILVGAIGLGIELGATAFCVEILGFPNMISKIAGTGVAFIFNYTSKQFYIFSHR